MRKVTFNIDEFNLINGELELNIESNETTLTNEQIITIYDYAIEHEMIVLAQKVLKVYEGTEIEIYKF